MIKNILIFLVFFVFNTTFFGQEKTLEQEINEINKVNEIKDKKDLNENIKNESTDSSRKEHFILKFGGNTSFFSGNIAQWKGTFSYRFGFGLEIPLGEKINLQPELNYFRLNAESKGTANITGDKLKISIIAIPLLFKYNLSNKFQIELGPQFSRITNFGIKRKDNGIIDEKPEKRINNFDYGASVGVSYEVIKNFSVNLNYYHGIKEVDKSPGVYKPYYDSDLGKLSYASFGLFYKIQ